MNFLRNVTQLVSNNEATQGLLENMANRLASSFVTGESKDIKVTSISESNLRSFTRLDSNSYASLFKDKSSALIVYLPTRKVVVKNMHEEEGSALAKKLNILYSGVNEDVNNYVSDAELERIGGFTLRNPDFHEVHLASALGLLPAFEKLLKDHVSDVLLNMPTANGQLPLQLACENGHFDIAQLCMTHGAKPEKTDANLRSAYHAAARSTDMRILKVLVTKARDLTSAVDMCLRVEDSDGYTPLQYAITSENLDAVKFLLSDVEKCQVLEKQVLRCLEYHKISDRSRFKQMAELLCAKQLGWVAKQDAAGDTVMHKPFYDAEIFRIVCSHAEKGALETVNGKGYSALQSAIMRNNLDACVTLASFGADVEKVAANGLSCVQLAIQSASLSIVKLLLLLGAPLDIEDLNLGKERTADYRAKLYSLAEHTLDKSLVSARDASLLTSNIARMRDWNTDRVRGEKNPLSVAISLDGGGMKGLITCQMLAELQRLTDDRIVTETNWLAGTSTGAIIAFALASGRSPTDCVRLYLRFKDEAFCGERPYSPGALEALLKAEFGDLTMGSLKKKVLVTTARVDVSPAELVLLRSYKIPNETDSSLPNLGKMRDVPLWKAARMSSAAPTYFPMAFNTYMDGGLIANNPSAELLGDLQIDEAFGDSGKPNLFLSLGTGIPPVRKVNETTSSGGVLEFLMKTFNVNVLHTLHMLTEQICAANGVVVHRSAGFANALGIPFYRFSPPLAVDIPLDCRDAATLIDAMWIAKVYTSSHPDLAKLLEFVEAAPGNE